MPGAGEGLVLRGLSTGYAGRAVVADLDLDPIAPGSLVSLLGPNAAGKTTLLRALAGLQPSKGSARLGATELLALPLVDHARLVTYMPQSLPQRVALTVLEAVIAALRAAPVDGAATASASLAERALEVIERVGIGHLAMEELSHLSGGQRQLASLAQALVREPRVLLLDEPISALDLHYQLRVMKLVRALARDKGVIVLTVLHDLSIAARWSDRVVLLSEGKVAADGSPAAAITPQMLAQVYRVSGRVEQGPGGLHISIDDTL